jgi:ankyrin repeat protein
MVQASGATPLLAASWNGHVECVRALLAGGAAINQAMVGSSCPCSAQHVAGMWVRIVEVMREVSRACVFGRERKFVWRRGPCIAGPCVVLQTSGATPLYVASHEGHVECVRALLSGGAAINQATVGAVFPTASHCQW